MTVSLNNFLIERIPVRLILFLPFSYLSGSLNLSGLGELSLIVRGQEMEENGSEWLN